MANLHVQPKKRNNSWIWIIIILLIIAAAIYYYVNYYSKGITPGSDKAFIYTLALQLKSASLF